MASQLGYATGRRVPSYEEALIRGRSPYATSIKATRDANAYQNEALGLQRQGLEQSASNAAQSLLLQQEQQDEAKRQAKQSETMGWLNTGVTAGLGAAKYGGPAIEGLKGALGLGAETSMYSAPSGILSGGSGLAFGEAAAPEFAGSMWQPSAGILSGGAPELTSGLGATGTSAEAAGTVAGVGEAGAWGSGATAAGYAAPIATGALGGMLATKIGGGKSVETRAAKGAAGGALAGAATGAAIGMAGGPIGAGAGAVIGGLAGAVTQIVGGGGGGRVICTKLVACGLLDPELHQAEAAWSLANKAKATVRGYHFWAVPFTRFMDGKPRFCKALSVVVRPYAKYLAYLAGSPLGNFNLLGLAVDLVGSAACWCIGKFVRFDKYGPEWDREDADRMKEMNHA
jgi:hypothetical protein